MPSEIIQHAMGLHLHQPAETLPRLLRQDEGELRRVLLCYERLARHAHKYAHVARLHVALSGVLLDQLRDPAFIEASRHLADIPAILDSLRGAPNIEFVGAGYRHAPLPLIPPEDWEEQLRNERLVMESVLGRVLKGYFPPASCFTLELVPALMRAGYEYVLLPHSALVMPDGHGADPYRAYRLRYRDAAIDVVPWDRGFSQSQEAGLDAAWFADEAQNGVAVSPESAAPYLLTTWSEGDAGEWFRRLDEEHGFFGHFFSPCMEFCETGEFPVRPVHLAEYLRLYPPTVEVELGSQMQAAALAAGLSVEAQAARKRLSAVVARYWSIARAAIAESGPSRAALQEARELILRAEESGFLLGDAARREEMLDLLGSADRLLSPKPAKSGKPVQPKPSGGQGAKAARVNAARIAPPPPLIPVPVKTPAPAKTAVPAKTAAPPAAAPAKKGAGETAEKKVQARPARKKERKK